MNLKFKLIVLSEYTMFDVSSYIWRLALRGRFPKETGVSLLFSVERAYSLMDPPGCSYIEMKWLLSTYCQIMLRISPGRRRSGDSTALRLEICVKSESSPISVLGSFFLDNSNASVSNSVIANQ